MSGAQIEAMKSLDRLFQFDPNDLIQKSRLGENAFVDAVPPASRVLGLYKRIPVEVVSELSENSAKGLKESADSTFSRISEILDFDLEQGAVRSRRDALIVNLTTGYDLAFDAILPIVAFSVAQATDFVAIGEKGRAAVQDVRDKTDGIQIEIASTLDEAKDLLEEVRNVAAENGVLKQAAFFRDEAASHVDSSRYWLSAAIVSGLVLVLYTSLTLLLSKNPIFTSETIYGSLQIAVSKVLLFSILTYAVIACVANYRSHRHNAVVNKHRQNALMTYRTLSEAGASPESRDTILNHAAAAIYAPVDSGYVKHEERGYGASLPAITLSPKSPSSLGVE